jgi:hypothetical protein
VGPRPEERPSNLKEHDKCVDTREWVQVNITHIIRDSESLNIAAQMLAAALNSVNMSSKRKRERTHQTSHPWTSQPEKPARSYPAARSANNGHLGMVLQNVGNRPSPVILRQKHPSSSPPDSGSSADDSGFDRSSSDLIVNDPDVDKATQSNDDRTSSRKRHGYKHDGGYSSRLPRSSRSSKIKLLSLLDYDLGGNLKADGSLKLGVYIRESLAYLRDGKPLGRHKKVPKEEEWNLLKFCDESFDYCFWVALDYP